MSSIALAPIRDVEDARRAIVNGKMNTIRSTIAAIPFFVPSVYTHVIEVHCRLDDNWSGDVSVVYKLNIFQRIFVLLEHESSCRLGFFLSLCMTGAVLINVIGFIVSAEMTSIPSSCSVPVCDNDPKLCPGRQVCEPVSPDVFGGLDDACIYVFTIDYLLRILTCWTVSPRLAGLTTDAMDTRSKFWQFLGYFFNIKNIVDFVSILPFFIFIFAYRGANHELSGFVRVLRIPRILRILNISKRFQAVNVIVEILTMTLSKASNALFFTFFFVCLSTLVFSSIMFILEQGKYVVNAQIHTGAYVREDVYGTPRKQITPFEDIAVSMYYVIVTLTTLGYGDEGMFVPTTPGGRALACVLCFSGILVLALPIAVIGNNFVDLYRRYTAKMEDLGKISWSDMKRAKLRATVGVNAADASLLDKLDLCVQHEKCCTDIAAKAVLVSDHATRQSDELNKMFFEVQSVISMVLYEVQVRRDERTREREQKRLEVRRQQKEAQQEAHGSKRGYTGKEAKGGGKGGEEGGGKGGGKGGGEGEGKDEMNGTLGRGGKDKSSGVTFHADASQSELQSEVYSGIPSGTSDHPSDHPHLGSSSNTASTEHKGESGGSGQEQGQGQGRGYAEVSPNEQSPQTAGSSHNNSNNTNSNGQTTSRIDNSRKDIPAAVLAARWPWLTPSLFVFVKTRPDVFFPYRIYQLSFLQRLFVFFEIPKSSKISSLFFLLLMGTIVVGVVSMVLQTDSTYMYQPLTCDSPACNNDPKLCPGVQICRPIPLQVFKMVDAVVIYIFTVDYVVRMCLCGLVPRRLADVISDDWDEAELVAANAESRAPRDEPPLLSTAYQMYCYFMQIPNMVDLIAIVPYYIELSYKGPLLSMFRVLRLTRILAITKISGASDYSQVLLRTIRKSFRVLIPLSFAVTLVIVLYACLIFVVEQGDFMVTPENPKGAYMRKNIDQNGLEMSPFRTISSAMYYVVVTLTTVGYGDLVPTSVGGRALACLFAYSGIVLWTFPIAIIGKNFVDEFKEMMDFEREQTESAKFALEEPEGRLSRESGLLVALEVLKKASKTIQLSSEESSEMCAFVEKITEYGRDSSVTAEVLRQVVAPAQDWLEHY